MSALEDMPNMIEVTVPTGHKRRVVVRAIAGARFMELVTERFSVGCWDTCGDEGCSFPIDEAETVVDAIRSAVAAVKVAK